MDWIYRDLMPETNNAVHVTKILWDFFVFLFFLKILSHKLNCSSINKSTCIVFLGGGILNFYFSIRFCSTNLIVNPKQGIHLNWSFQIEDFSPHSDTHYSGTHSYMCVCVRTLFKPSCHKNIS